jgi:hypothetical protein
MSKKSEAEQAKAEEPKDEAVTPLPDTGPVADGGFTVENMQPGGGLPGPTATGDVPSGEPDPKEVEDRASHDKSKRPQE